MADKAKKTETPDAAGGEGAAPKKPPMMIFAIVGVLVVFIVGFVVAKKMMGKPAAPAVPVVGEHVALDEFLVNLADSTNDHYLKTQITLGLVKEVTAEQFKDDVPQTRDAILMLLSSKSLEDIRTPAGKAKLKTAIADAVNKAVGKKDVLEVDFQTFATQ
jgi:flagellar FliL protein